MEQLPDQAAERRSRRTVAVLLAILILVQTAIYIFAGMRKAYIHMDEGYSYGLASYHSMEIVTNEDFYDTWHDKDYYLDYLVLNEDERGDLSPVYWNQVVDNHPPLYYLFLRIAMNFSVGRFSVWPGIVLNIIVYTFVTVFSYLILLKLLAEQKNRRLIAAVLAFLASITLASVSNVIFIRMYAMSALNVLITTYLHMLLRERFRVGTLVLIGVSALVGSLTHYFYLFFLFMLFVMTEIRYLKRKEYRHALLYFLALAAAAGVSLAIFPYSVGHMLFSKRGTGVISNLTDPQNLLQAIERPFIYGYVILLHNYHFVLGAMLLACIPMGIVLRKRGQKPVYSEHFRYIWIPALFLFLLAAISSPWVVLRYVVPACIPLYFTAVYLFAMLLEKLIGRKKTVVAVAALLAVSVAVPVVFGIEPLEMYSQRKQIVTELAGEKNLPTVYWLNTEDERFLDDILLFSEIDESYVAKDREPDPETVRAILEGRDLSRGMILFINRYQDDEAIFRAFREGAGLGTVEQLETMFACRIYYLTP